MTKHREESVTGNPDWIAEPTREESSSHEGIRLILDDAALRLKLFSPLENAVFFAVHVDGLTEREAARRLNRSHKEIRLAVSSIRRIVRRVIARLEAGLPPAVQP